MVFPLALVAGWLLSLRRRLLVAVGARAWRRQSPGSARLAAAPPARGLGHVAVATSGAAFCVAAASCLGQISPHGGDSAWSVGQAVVSMTGGGVGADLPSRALHALAACAKAFGAVGSALVLCALVWGNARRSSRVLAAVTACGLLADGGHVANTRP